MKNRVVEAAMVMLSAMLLLPYALTSASPSPAPLIQPGGFTDEAFKSVWTRTDAPVANGRVKRSYYWGPAPSFSTMEEYAEGLGGKRLVQYFDKSRMEVNNPAGNKRDPFYVTNGLLTVELISGRMQVGNNSYVTRYPAEIDIASDTDDNSPSTPTYASFAGAANKFVSQGSSNLGETVVSTINRAGGTGSDPRFGRYDVTYIYHEPATSRSIPDVFWRFLNAEGPVVVDGREQTARLSDPYFYATGYPIADAYWASVKIAGVTGTDVLIQPFERRVLTYVPSAPEGFRVQMGNIGRHYYDWRYVGLGSPVPPTPKPPVPPISCRTSPIRGFGKVWADHPEVQSALNCPRSSESTATVLQQPFQHGYMLQITDFPNRPYERDKFIYVLFEGGSLQKFQDNYAEGDPEPVVTPPSGLYAPRRGFGKLWREGTGAKVRERLGWATAPETLAQGPTLPFPGGVPTAFPPRGSTATPTAVPGAGGAAQDFDKGYMVYSGPVLRKIYVLYNKDQFTPVTLTNWLVYDDLFREP